jgi:hypothetical protein
MALSSRNRASGELQTAASPELDETLGLSEYSNGASDQAAPDDAAAVAK